MRADNDIKRDVEAELRWDVDAPVTDVSVRVTNGVVTLSGCVPRLFQKHEAARAARFVSGVTAIANDIVVRSHDVSHKTDAELAREIVAGLKFWLPDSWYRITPTVQDGHVVLDGTVEWHQQRERAEGVARSVKGVASVGNSVHVAPMIAGDDAKLRIPVSTKVTNNLRVKP